MRLVHQRRRHSNYLREYSSSFSPNAPSCDFSYFLCTFRDGYPFECLEPRITLLDVWDILLDLFHSILVCRPHLGKREGESSLLSSCLLITFYFSLLNQFLNVTLKV